jgi:hypothetical protein
VQKEIFQVNGKYRVKRSFNSAGFNFIKDEVVTLEHAGYSPYDNCYIYTFHDNHGNARAWILEVDSTGDEGRDLFEKLS